MQNNFICNHSENFTDAGLLGWDRQQPEAKNFLRLYSSFKTAVVSYSTAE